MTATLDVDYALLEQIAAQLDLRDPNCNALRTIAELFSDHFEVRGRTDTFEGILDVATGVGKTYVLASAIDYLAQARGTRNFAVITPGKTILIKTAANFTPGNSKSLVGGMTTKLTVITSENFNTPAMRAAMEDEDAVKLFIFTVQALVAPTSNVSKRTHKFQEGLGEAFYDHLEACEDLVIFADEHHCYYGPKFSDAVRDLTPAAIIGLTATPHSKTPEDQIIYRYPLGGAIADELVKTPVIVGRKDDRSDMGTKLRDAVTLLQLKEAAINEYCARTGAAMVNPVGLVIAKDIADAEAVGDILRDDSFFGGAYREAVLVVHSKQPDEALEQLEKVEDIESPVRIIVSVGMLKEGWDVKNVYVIVSLRSLVSEILTEQTLGRGLRLPFGAYTGIEFLDTLEVLAHERYDQLLKKVNVINEAFVDYRTHAVLRKNAAGQTVAVVETVQGDGTTAQAIDQEDEAPEAGSPAVAPTDVRVEQGQLEMNALKQEIAPREDFPLLKIPILRTTTVESPFSLSDIVDREPFTKLGRRLAANPEDTLRRTVVSAEIVTGRDGIPETRLKTSSAVDEVRSQGSLMPKEAARAELVRGILAAEIAPARPQERAAAQELVDSFMTGLGGDAEELLGAYFNRALAHLIELMKKEQKKYASKPKFEEVVEFREYRPTRVARGETSRDLAGSFKRQVGYEGWKKSMFAQEWFDSRPERDVANILENAKDVSHWIRLQVKELPIRWEGSRDYNPDLIAIETDGTRWVIEVKSDAELASENVQGKREAALRWANHVNHSRLDPNEWRYVLVGESDIGTARGSWRALRELGR
ncbi:MAG: DEAD/DEAH box helicase [Actinomycetota bacterium]